MEGLIIGLIILSAGYSFVKWVITCCLKEVLK